MRHIPRRFALPVIGVALAVTAAGCAAPAAQRSELTSVRMAVLGFHIPATWDPTSGFVTTYFMPTQAVYESLFQLDPEDYTYQPLLAEEFTISDDRRTMTVLLPEDVDFTDGTHLDAAAVKTAIDDVIAGPTYFQTELGAAFDTAVEVTGDYELEITTSGAMTPRFMNALAILPIASPAAIDAGTLETAPAGTGPYLVSDQVAEVSISFVRNPDYRDPEAYPFDELEFDVFDDNIAAANALKSGQIDLAALDTSLVGDVESAGFALHIGGGAVPTLLWFDRAGVINPALADVRVRQAISYALDREGMNEQLNLGYGRATSQVFVEGQPEYIEGGDDRYGYDPDRARELLAEAGYADGFELVMPSFPSTYEKFYPVLQQLLGEIGITLTLEPYPDGNFDWTKYAMIFFGNGDTYWVPGLEAGGIMNSQAPEKAVDPAIAPILARMANGDADESADASQELGEFLLEEQWYILVSRYFEVYASIPEIDLEVGNVAGLPPILPGLQRAD